MQNQHNIPAFADGFKNGLLYECLEFVYPLVIGTERTNGSLFVQLSENDDAFNRAAGKTEK